MIADVAAFLGATPRESGSDLAAAPVRPAPADGSSPAFWKVWWDGRYQVKAAVSIQESLNAPDAQQGLIELNGSVPGLYPNESALTIPDLPGAFGYSWVGKDTVGNGGSPYRIDAAMFRRGTAVAIVSMKAYGNAALDSASFFAFARSEDAVLGTGPSILPKVLFGSLLLVGFGIVIVGYALRHNAAIAEVAPGLATWPPAGAAAGFAPPYGSQRPWTAGPRTPPWLGGAAPAGPSLPGPQMPLPPAGWYPDPHVGPSDPQALRYWDGMAWTAAATARPADATTAPDHASSPPAG